MFGNKFNLLPNKIPKDMGYLPVFLQENSKTFLNSESKIIWTKTATPRILNMRTYCDELGLESRSLYHYQAKHSTEKALFKVRNTFE